MMLALLALGNCVALGPAADGILARDLAPALPALADVAVVVSPAPVPGVQRVFRMSELQRMAARFGVAGEPAKEMCFERPAAPPSRDQLEEALRRQLPEARIEILDYGRMPVPEGEIEFPLKGLRRAGADGFWSGSVKYGAGRTFPLWVRVRVSVREPRVVAAEDLPAGRPITAGQLRMEDREVFPREKGFAPSVDTAAGRAARLAIAAGTVVRLDALAAAQDVVRGDRVSVEVHSGGAYLRLEGIAEASGAVGQSIPVTNPGSHKRFWARVEGKGRVVVGKGPS